MKIRLIVKMLLTLAVPAVLLSGCMEAIMQKTLELSASGHTSKYMPILYSQDSRDKYFDLITSVNRQAVTDEQGAYYHELSGKKLYRTFLNKNDEGVLRTSFTNGVGLMAPFLKFGHKPDTGPVLTVDWETTTAMHEFLTKKLRLKLLPLSQTKQYLASLQELSKNRTQNYSAKTQGEILKKASITADYVILHGPMDDYYNNYPGFSRGQDFRDEESYTYFSEKTIIDFGMVSFKSVKVLQEQTEGSTYMDSGLEFMDLARFNDLLVFKSKKSSIVSVNGPATREAMLAADAQNKRKQLESSKKFYLEALSNQGKFASLAPRSFEAGLTALGMSGFIKSKKLD